MSYPAGESKWDFWIYDLKIYSDQVSIKNEIAGCDDRKERDVCEGCKKSMPVPETKKNKGVAAVVFAVFDVLKHPRRLLPERKHGTGAGAAAPEYGIRVCLKGGHE